jgi:hypothetical protein
MRDPGRIKPILGTIERLWQQNPDWRLGQLITNAANSAGAGYYGDVFHLRTGGSGQD